jgi:peptide/nickel transport system ATP-binding protein
MSGEPVLDIRHLTIRAGDGRPLVEDLSLHAERGDHVALIGESGSGKSLTSLAVMGLLPTGMSASGSIRVCGQEMVGTPDRVTRRLRGARMGIVFQEPMTALDP